MARMSGAAAGTPWKTNASRNVGAQHMIGVKLLRARQRFSLGYRRAETVPRNDRGDRIKCVLFAVARRNQGGADPGIKTDFLVDGATVGLERVGRHLA